MPAEVVVLAHNRYRQPGGEEAAVEAEAALLEERGHRVLRFERDSSAVPGMNAFRIGADTMWNSAAATELGRLVRTERASVVHFHNTFPLISPAAYYAARAAGAATVQTLHNYRLLCPGGLFLRDGAPCESCLGKSVAWPGVVHGCFHASRARTSLVAGMLSVHRVLGTWTQQVDAYIALSRFARERFVSGGLPPDRLHVKSGFVSPDPGTGVAPGEHLLFVGRLSEEKGVRVLLQAWQMLPASARLRVVGSGPLASAVAEAAANDPRIEVVGWLPRERVLEEMRTAYALVFPSICYENFPGAVVEAYACGLPVIATSIGSMIELVEDDVTGVAVAPGDATALAAEVRALLAEPTRRDRLSAAARERYLAQYTEERVYTRLMQIYTEALEHRKTSAAPADGLFSRFRTAATPTL